MTGSPGENTLTATGNGRLLEKKTDSSIFHNFLLDATLFYSYLFSFPPFKES